jgi:hypothetical protein
MKTFKEFVEDSTLVEARKVLTTSPDEVYDDIKDLKKIRCTVTTGQKMSGEVYERIYTITVLNSKDISNFKVEVESEDITPSGMLGWGTDKKYGRYAIDFHNTLEETFSDLINNIDNNFVKMYFKNPKNLESNLKISLK